MTRQQTRFLALMQGYDQAAKYAEEAANSTGLAAQKLTIYQESVEAKQQKMTAAFEDFSQSILSSGLIKGFYDIGAGLLNFGTAIPSTIKQIIALGSAFAFLKSTMAGIKATAFGRSFLGSFQSLAEPQNDEVSNIAANHLKKTA